VLKPCIPDDWPEFRIEGRLPDDSAGYRVTVGNPDGFAKRVVAATLDGVAVEPDDGIARIPLPRDGAEHEIRITMG
jgi:cellobiose phosphorylase